MSSYSLFDDFLHVNLVPTQPHCDLVMRNVTSGEEPAQGVSRPQRDRRKQKNNLQAQIRKSYVDSDFPPGGGKFSYLPRDCIESLVTREAVAAELGLQDLAHHKQYKGLIEWILSSAPRLFLIVLNSQFVRGQEELHDSMALFRSSGFDDSELPWSESCKFPEDDGGDLDDTWTRSDMIEHFPPAQWKFLALVIRSGIFTYNVQPKVILPFTQVSSEKPKEGAFGKVYRVKIHQSHTDYSFDEIAVKEIQTDEGLSQASTVEAAWQAEVGVLKLIKGIPNPHLIECLAAIERGRDRYLLFPWADGGSLRDYWENTPHQTPTHSLVKEALVQLQGLGAALSGLHYLGLNDNSEDAPDDLPHVHTEDVAEEYNSNSAEASIRHGDLKPENLLWFTERSRGVEGARYLKIADMGLAKRHVVRTQDRSRLTTTTYGTILYEAPEAEPALGDQPRSRLYDIWSMGCIITEWIIWLLYGNKQLQRFYNDLKGPNHDPKKPVAYYILSNTSLGRQSQEPILHPQVVHWISHIRSKHPECQRKSAINDLLKLVEEKLLVFRLPDRRLTTMSRAKSRGDPLPAPSIDDSTIRYRATSIDFEKAMSNILHEVEISHDYLLMSSVTELSTASHPPSRGSRLHPQTAALTPSAAQPPAGLGVPQLALPTRTARNNYTLPPLEDWKFPVDNDFAEDLAALLGQKSLAPTLSKRAKLCEACSRLKIWEAGFDVAYQRDKLQQNSTLCDLCSLLWHAWSNASEEVKSSAVINFDRIGSTIHIRGAASQAALSLFRSPGTLRLISGFQIGLPQLPKPDSELSSQISRQWLKDCDNHHSGCNFVGNSRLPTRLLHLGSEEEPILRLLETANGISGDARYIALSHRWGDTQKHRPLRTELSNLEAFKQAIPQADVPQTFADAITVTRCLGIQYLWIDSLCIIQGDGGDFSTEAKRMEDVFSCAYCVIAASRASNQREGFLHKPRPQRRFITIQQEREPPFYVCETIDDFGRHVLDGALNSRGWVLQERALARRTIFFTDSQTYFECGQGVRCETLAKMQNDMADFLGDPRFPDKAMKEKSRAVRIRYFQDLYRRYSQLEFSHIQDRPIAIAGLENRLLKAYTIEGGYGIFDDGPGKGLFHRSLLWQRSEEEDALKAIDFSSRPDSAAPTWSWMAYEGGIDYLDPPFQETEWERTDVEPPWSVTGGGSDGSHRATHLKVMVRPFSVAGAPEHKLGKIKFTYDNSPRKGTSDRQSPLCVVIAKEKGNKSSQEKIHYVLVVIGTGGGIEQGQRCFSRLGVGFLPGRYIGLQEDGVRGIVC